MTEQEQAFVVSILKQISINAADPKAAETITMIQGILAKLTPEPKGE